MCDIKSAPEAFLGFGLALSTAAEQGFASDLQKLGQAPAFVPYSGIGRAPLPPQQVRIRWSAEVSPSASAAKNAV